MTSQRIITFVFSDIEHSTKLAQQLGELYPAILEKHREVIRKFISRYNGKEIDTAGDGFFMTFNSPDEAILASMEIQKVFQTESWALSIGLKVRMGVHTGIGLATQNGFTGVEVHYAARICNAAHGGQILLSIDTEKALNQKQTEAFHITDLGEFLLKDFSKPVDLFQLNINGLKNNYPPLRIEPQEKRLAILPFVNIEKDPQLAYIGEGLAEELIVGIGKVQGIRVVSRSLAFPIAESLANPMDIGEKLNVSAVLEGRIKTSGDQLKIAAELINTENGFNMWSAHFDTTRENLLHIQDEIKHKITDVMGGAMVTQQQNSIQKRQSQNAEAYDFYLRGRRFYLQFSNRGVSLAQQMLQKAIEADSTYALAYAGLADCFIYQYQHTNRSKAILKKADEMSKKAIDMAPTFPEVHVSRGIVLAELGLFEEAEKFFQYAIETDPTLFWGWYQYARASFISGRLEKAGRLFEESNRVEPEDYQSLLLAAQVYDDLGIVELAESLRVRGVQLAENCIDLNPGDTRALYMAANAYALLGEKKKSLSLLNIALALEPGDSMMLYNAGCVYALLEMKEEAMLSLERAFEAGLTLIGWYQNDSNLDILRAEPRFIRLLEKIKKMPQAD